MASVEHIEDSAEALLTDEFFEKCGLNRMRPRHSIVGEIDAILMLSSYRDVDIDDILDDDPAVRFLQGKSLSTIRKSLASPTERPRLSAMLSSGSHRNVVSVSSLTSFAESNRTDYTPRATPAMSPDGSGFSDVESDVEADDNAFDADDFDADNEYETDNGITPGSILRQRSPSWTETQSQLYSFLDEEYDESESRFAPFVTFGYVSETVTEDEDHVTGLVTAQQSLLRLQRTASDNVSSAVTSANNSKRNSRVGLPIVPAPKRLARRGRTAPDEKEPEVAPPLFKSRSAHVGMVSDDMLYTRIGLMHNPELMGLGTRVRQSSNSMMSSTSYLLYDSEDTPPPPSCNITPELYVHSSLNKNGR